MSRSFLLSMFLLMTAGCGGGESYDRIDVSGDVVFNGKALASGQVLFSPAEGNKAAKCLAIIKDGKFKSAPGNGPSKGNYDVTVIVYGDSSGNEEDEEGSDNPIGTYEESAVVSETENTFSYSFDAGELSREQ